MTRRPWLLLGALAGAASACSIYGPDLTGSGGATSTSASSSSSGGGAGTTTSSMATGATGGTATTTSSSSTTSSSTTSSSSTGTGGAPTCTTDSECPGTDTACKKRKCTGGTCGFESMPSGTVLAAQMTGDCKIAVCDSAGNESSIPDNNDKPNDNKPCTTDGCSGGTPTFTPVTPGTPCTGPNGAKVCSAAGNCVECVDNGDCASSVCKTNICVAAQCNDGIKNGAETDVDCGGGACPKCGFNDVCGSDSDCLSTSCIGGHCAASCNDTVKNGSETDVDCGGACPANCAAGKSCNVAGDCQSGQCTANKCVEALLISEVRTRGSNGGNDELIEIYNPSSVAVQFDATWSVWARGATSVCSALMQRYAGAGQMIPSHGHLLIANGGGYDDATAYDGMYAAGSSMSDSGQVVLLRNNALVDSVCFYFNATTQANLTCATPPAMWFPCQGAVSNLPHNNSGGSVDVSIERKPGGALGNGQNTGDNTADFTGNVTSTPQNLASPTTP